MAGELGWFAVLALFLRAYSLGGGTYTGIEAVSNAVPVMREPRVKTAQRTMGLMAVSLAITAGGIMIGYLLVGVEHVPGRTLNAVLADSLFDSWHPGGLPVGLWLAMITIFSEGALLFVAAQSGFLDGPRVLSNMALDSWVPHRLAQLSDRFVTRNGVWLMGLAAIAALVYTRGAVGLLVVMYSINVFLTFSLSMGGMCRYWMRPAPRAPVVEAGPGPARHRADALPLHPGGHGLREILPRRLGHGPHHLHRRGRLLLDPQPLPAGQAEPPAAGRDPGQHSPAGASRAGKQ